jgi:glycosyltransferase involved in cell wall biosynthesis
MILNTGMAEEAYSAGFSPEQLLWMPNPVDTAEFAPAGPEEKRVLRDRLMVAQDTPVILYVGRLAPEKELPSLLGALSRLLPRMPAAQLVLVGDGPDREALTAHSTRLGLAANVRFTGRQTIAEVLQWLQVADVFALVSSNEGFPCSLVEAMSVGLPSVVSDIPANLQLIQQNQQGLSAPMGDEAALAAALERLLSNPEQAARMGEAARRSVLEQYSLDQVVDRYEALFQEALQHPR